MFWTRFVLRIGENSLWLEHGLCHQGAVEAQEGSLSQILRGWVCCTKSVNIVCVGVGGGTGAGGSF